MKVLILWADSRSANLGVRVLAEGMRALAMQAFGPGTEVDFQDYGPGDSAIGFGGRTILKDVGRKNGPIVSKVAEYDVILDSGAGDSFADIYGAKRLITMNYAHRATHRARVPLVLGPQTIGPFTRAWSRVLARSSVHIAKAVFARDSTSREFAAALGCRPLSSTDVVFALPKTSVAEDTRDVVMNVSGLLWNSDRHGDSTRYRSAVTATIDRVRASGREVALMAHVIDNPTTDNDVPAIQDAARLVAGDIETIVPRDLDHAREVVAGASVVIGARMHACLNALSTGTPAIPWAYSRKFAPLLSDIGWDTSLDVRETDALPGTTLRLLEDGFRSDEVSALNARARARLDEAAATLRSLVGADHAE